MAADRTSLHGSLTAQIPPHSPRGVAHLSQTIEDCTALAIEKTGKKSTWATGFVGGLGFQDCKGATLINCSILRCRANLYGGLELMDADLEMVGGIVASCSSGNMEGGGLTASAGATLVLDDLLVSDCESRVDWTTGLLAAGGGIWARANSIVRMTGGAIRDCRAPTAYGGGLRCDGTSVVELRNVKVQGCKAFKGAAISIAEPADSGGPEVSLSDVDIEACVSDNNVIVSQSRLVAERVRVVRSGPGRAVSLFKGSSGTWTDCTFSDGTWAGQTDARGAVIHVLAGMHTFTRTAVLRSSGNEAGPKPSPSHPKPVQSLPTLPLYPTLTLKLPLP